MLHIHMDRRINVVRSLPFGAHNPVGSNVHVTPMKCDQSFSRALHSSGIVWNGFPKSSRFWSLRHKEFVRWKKGEIVPGQGTSIRKRGKFREQYFRIRNQQLKLHCKPFGPMLS